jgi:predicted DNA-binding mobile mystery protein A
MLLLALLLIRNVRTMKYVSRLEKIKRLDDKLELLKPIKNVHRPIKGWIRAIRTTLGMTTAQMAIKIGVSQPRIVHIEQSEPLGEIKISTMHKVADGLEMDFFYGFIPKKSLEYVVKERATQIAKERMKKVGHTMALESQGISAKKKEEMLKKIVADLLHDIPKKFWE